MTSTGRFRVGQTAIEVSPMGMGTWAWGDRLVWGFGRGYGEPEVKAAYRASRASGVDFFDTAEIYGQGRSERILGRLAGEGGGPPPPSPARPFSPPPRPPPPGGPSSRPCAAACGGSASRASTCTRFTSR